MSLYFDQFWCGIIYMKQTMYKMIHVEFCISSFDVHTIVINYRIVIKTS